MIENFIAAIDNFDAFAKHQMASYACVRALEIMGEAVKHIPDDFRNQHPQIPWRKIAGIRDVLIHDYAGVDLQVIWKTITINLPQIKPHFEELVADASTHESS